MEQGKSKPVAEPWLHAAIEQREAFRARSAAEPTRDQSKGIHPLNPVVKLCGRRLHTQGKSGEGRSARVP